MTSKDPIELLRESSHLDDSKWTLENGEVVIMFCSEPDDQDAINWGEQWRKIADEIEAQYMKLPVDADGVPIQIGDRMHYEKYDQTFTVNAIVYSNDLVYVKDAVNGDTWKPDECRHVKPDTVESLLEEFYMGTHATTTEERESLVKEFAERIRKAVEDG